MEIPAAGALIGTPASIKAKTAEDTEAIDVEPLLDRISETILIV